MYGPDEGAKFGPDLVITGADSVRNSLGNAKPVSIIAVACVGPDYSHCHGWSGNRTLRIL